MFPYTSPKLLQTDLNKVENKEEWIKFLCDFDTLTLEDTAGYILVYFSFVMRLRDFPNIQFVF